MCRHLKAGSGNSPPVNRRGSCPWTLHHRSVLPPPSHWLGPVPLCKEDGGATPARAAHSKCKYTHARQLLQPECKTCNYNLCHTSKRDQMSRAHDCTRARWPGPGPGPTSQVHTAPSRTHEGKLLPAVQYSPLALECLEAEQSWQIGACAFNDGRAQLVHTGAALRLWHKRLGT